MSSNEIPNIIYDANANITTMKNTKRATWCKRRVYIPRVKRKSYDESEECTESNYYAMYTSMS